jgi:hypothetical protein
LGEFGDGIREEVMATYWHYLIPRAATFRPDAQALANLTDLWLREGWLPAGLKGCAACVRADCISNLGLDGELPRNEDRVFTRRFHDPYLSSVATPLSKAWFLKNTTDVEVTVHTGPHKYIKYMNIVTSELSLRFDFKLEFRGSRPRFAARQYDGVEGGWYEPKIEQEPRIPLSPFPTCEEAEYILGIEIATDFIHRTVEMMEPFDTSDTVCGQCRHQLGYEHVSDQRISGGPYRIQAICPNCRTAFDPSNLFAIGRHPVTGADGRYQGGATSRFAILIEFEFHCSDIAADLTFRAQCEEVLGCRLIDVFTGDV